MPGRRRAPRQRGRSVAVRGRRFRVAIRQFLNRPGFHGKAAVIASVEDTSVLDEAELRFHRVPDIYLSISDCSKECALEFNLEGREAQRNSLYKINTLIASLERFRDALESESALYNERTRTIWRSAA